MTAHSILRTLTTACVVTTLVAGAAPQALADDSPRRPFVGGAALASVQPERFAARRTLRGAPEETKPAVLLVGGVTLTRWLAVQGEVSFGGRWRPRDRAADDQVHRFEWRDGLVSGVMRWRAATIGAVSFEPVGGLTLAVAGNQPRRDPDDRRVDVTRGGLVGGADVGIGLVRRLSVVPTFRVHRLARERRDRDETPRLKDGRNVYRFGVGARWVF